MFGARLWIFLMLSVAFAGLVHGKKNLKCNYYKYKLNYACQLFGKTIQNEHEVVSFSGDHLREFDDNSVTMLAFYQSTVHYIPTDLFSKFNNLRWFECDGCYLRKIEKNDFKNAGNLKLLRLRSGNLELLQNGTFFYSDELESLALQSNIISEIELKAFAGLRHLKDLFLHHNRIESLKPEALVDLINLEKLHLEDNKIEKLNKDLFKSNKNLKEIYFTYNRIAVLDPNLISHLNGLTYIDFRLNACGNREEFFDSRPEKLQTTFNLYAPQCTEENRLKNKLN
jgi:hypothetical protein